MENKQGCAFRLPGQAILVYVWHLKTRDEIKIWPQYESPRVTELESFVGSLNLIGIHRKTISKGWAQTFPLPILLKTHEDLTSAVKVLIFALKAKQEVDTKKSRSTVRNKDAEQYELLADELSKPDLFPEGGRKSVVINAYERSSRARAMCIKHHGPTCQVCKLDFGQRYGEIGKGFIHVHHILEISKMGVRYKVDLKKDLRPVCPNCHAMLHRSNPPMSIEQLKTLLVKG